MTPLKRAEVYAAIFINVGDDWPYYVPVDATVKDDTVYLQGVRMERLAEDRWRLTKNAAWCEIARAS